MKRFFNDRVVGAIWLICGAILTNFSVEVYRDWFAIWTIGMFITAFGMHLIIKDARLFATKE